MILPLLLIFLFGICFSAQAQSTSNTSFLRQVHCSASARMDQAFNITIYNPTPYLLSLYWVDDQCRNVFYYDIGPSIKTLQPSWVNFSWLVMTKDTERVFDRFTALTSIPMEWNIHDLNATTTTNLLLTTSTAVVQPTTTNTPRVSPPVSVSPSSSKSGDQDPSPKSPLALGTLIGGIVGCIVILVMIVFAIVFAWRGSRNPKPQHQPFVPLNRFQIMSSKKVRQS